MNKQMTNSQSEQISISRVSSGDFTGQHVLIIKDDDGVSNTQAPHLLDTATIDWLLENLTLLKEGT